MDGMAIRADWSCGQCFVVYDEGQQAAWQPVEVVAGFSGRRGFGISYGLPRARAA